MDTLTQDTLFFFDRHQSVYPLYECFREKLLARFPESRIKVQKSQISYYYSLQLHSGSFPKPLSAEEERHYLSLSAQGDLKARNILVSVRDNRTAKIYLKTMLNK